MNQEHPDQRYLDLAEKWLNGTITPEEESEYAEWYNTVDRDAELEIPADRAMDKESHRKEIFKSIRRRQAPAVPLYSNRLLRFSSAAAILLVLAGLSWWIIRQQTARQPGARAVAQKNDVKPGSDGAILTLADGRTILLDTAGNGVITGSGSIIEKSGGTVSISGAPPGGSTPLHPSSSPSSHSEFSLSYNTLRTPRARQQHLVLSDGTGIWLNAGSSIRWPVVFAADRREVEITGEAYLEVAKEPGHPFLVRLPSRGPGGPPAAIEVLGTRFNIMAYSNEENWQTTLMEGAVRFRQGDQAVRLKPGQQSRLTAGYRITPAEDADIDLAIAWKNGVQAFSGADIPTIMRQVERWYDIDVEYQGEVPQRTFTGLIPRSANLSELLSLLKAVNIHFDVDAARKKLIIKP